MTPLYTPTKFYQRFIRIDLKVYELQTLPANHNFDGDEIKLAFTSLWLFTKGSNKTESKIKDKNICSVFCYFYFF